METLKANGVKDHVGGHSVQVAYPGQTSGWKTDSFGSLKRPLSLFCLINTTIMPITVLHALCKALSILDAGVSPGPSPITNPSYPHLQPWEIPCYQWEARKDTTPCTPGPNAQSPVHHQVGQRSGLGSGVTQNAPGYGDYFVIHKAPYSRRSAQKQRLGYQEGRKKRDL